MLSKLTKISHLIKNNYSLKNLTWFKTDSYCDMFFAPETIDDLIYFLQNKPADTPIYVLGAGSNMLFRKNVNGCIIKLVHFNKIYKEESDFIIAESFCLNSVVCNFATQENIGGFEFLTQIPGTIGGGIAMNAGAFNKEFKDIVCSVKALDYNGNIYEFSNKDIGFSYRNNSLFEKLSKNFIFISAKMKGQVVEQNIIKNTILQIKLQRDKAQPKKVLTGGSTFTNPKNSNYKAWQLIDKVNLRGYKIGGAEFSTVHANFIINTNNATALDIENLIKLAQKLVQQEFSINLETEIK